MPLGNIEKNEAAPSSTNLYRKQQYTTIDLFVNENCVLTSMQRCRIYLLLHLYLDDLHCAAYKLVFTYEIWEVIFEVKRHFTGSKLLFVVVYKLQVNLTLIH